MGSSRVSFRIRGFRQELYFRGFRNLEAILADLVARRALKNATDLVLTGCSAGGLAAYLHADYIAALVPNATVIAAPDSGVLFPIPLSLSI